MLREATTAGAPVVTEETPRVATTPRVSVVMPVYNESEVIADVIRELATTIADRFDSAEIVAVNDCSTDDTAAILDRLAGEDERVRVIHAERNCGHGPSLRRALDEARGDWLFQIDSDGQQLAQEFWDLWEQRQSSDLVMGVRPILRNGRHRVVVSVAARQITRALGGGKIRDVNVPFKLFRRAVWEDLRDQIPPSPHVPSLLITLGASSRGWRVTQVPISSLPREHGPSTVNVSRLVRLCSGACAELLRFRMRLLRRRTS
jgi:dolichol-phosphate mannosyltransferase